MVHFHRLGHKYNAYYSSGTNNLTDYSIFLLLLLNSGERIILMMTTNGINRYAPYPIMNNVIFLVGYSPYSSSLTITAIQRRRPQAQHRPTVQQYTNLSYHHCLSYITNHVICCVVYVFGMNFI